MNKKLTAKNDIDLVLTANRLEDGIVVYFTGDHWSEKIEDALISKDAESLTDTANEKIQNENFVSVDVIAVERATKNISPVIMREKIRSAGPTINY